jgi:release factor glutamine methyltransferase
VGTGSGAIALALKSARPDAVVMAVDTSAQALQRARENAEKLQVTLEILKSDLLSMVQGDFDAVVANLPYIAEDEKSLMDPETAFEPKEALFAPDQGLALIRRLVSEVSEGKRLRPQGRLWLEIGFRQGAAVQKICTDAGLTARIHKDEAGHDRIVEGFWA